MLLRRKTKCLRVKLTPDALATLERLAATQGCRVETYVGIVMQRYAEQRQPPVNVSWATRRQFVPERAANES